MFDKLKKRLGLDISPENLHIRAAQLNVLIAELPFLLGMNSVLEALLVWVMWERLDHTILLSWLATLYLIHAQEILHWLRSPKKLNSIAECTHWQRQFMWSFGLVGAVWGSAGFLMFITDNPVMQAILICVMVGMAAGVVASNQSFLLAQQSYVVLILLPTMFSLFLQRDRDYYLLATMLGLFLLFVAKTGRDQSRNLELSIRRQFENAELLSNLRRANDQLALAQRAAQAGVWEWDIVNGRLIWTDELFFLFGLDPRVATASFEQWHQIIHPADKDRAGAAVSEAVRNGTPLFNEYRIVMPDGELKCIVALGNITRNELGETVSMKGLCYDNTAQKSAQRRAHQAESRYHALIEQAGSILLVHDLEGCLLEVNRQACESWGYAREELLSMKIDDIVEGFDSERSKARWAQLEFGTPATFNSRHRRKDGSSFPVEVRLTSIVLDEQRLIMSLAVDISERLSFEAALQSSEERYRTFAEKLPLGIAVLQDGLVMYANTATTRLIGYPLESLLGQPFIQLIHEEDRARMIELHRKRMQGEDVDGVFPVKMIRKDGVVRQWELNTSTTEWDGKRSSLAIVSDITERVAMEAAMRQSLRQLEEKELAKTRFLAAAGHDLRQPVAAANLFVEALKNTDTDERQSRLIERLDQSMSVFSDLLERMLDISRFDAGLVKPQIVSFDLTGLFNWLDQNFAGSARSRGLDFRFSFSLRNALVVHTDIGLLRSVMMNLVGNAIKYTSDGGVLVSARCRRDHMLLQVWDTGCGIAQEDIGKIFDEFYQVNNPQRNREAGLGLGLSICQRAAALLGGSIQCRSVLARGSVFSLILPLQVTQRPVENVAMPQRAEAETQSDMFAGKRVVVLEDDSLVADGLINLLQGLGARVTHFQSAEDALQQSDIHTADYYLADFSLGDRLTGADFLHVIRRRSGGTIRGVLVTGETSSSFIEGIAGLPWPVLHKPINYAKLAAALNS
jgi:PAS domain S-box-containing protein